MKAKNKQPSLTHDEHMLLNSREAFLEETNQLRTDLNKAQVDAEIFKEIIMQKCLVIAAMDSMLRKAGINFDFDKDVEAHVAEMAAQKEKP